MTTVGIVAPGAMGTAVGRCLLAGGHRVLTTAAGRSDATRRRLVEAGLEDAADLDALVSAADVVVSVVPPGQALAAAGDLAAAMERTGARPLVVEANAVAPGTVADVAARLPGDLVDAAISGPPPSPTSDAPTRIFLAGPRAGEIAALDVPGVRWVALDAAVGAASAAKMCTGSVRKGFQALLTHALVTADAHGVLDTVLDDVRLEFPHASVAHAASAVTKAWRFADEMDEVAATQEAVGLGPELLDGVAAAYRALATSEWGHRRPEDVPADLADPSGLRPARPGTA